MLVFLVRHAHAAPGDPDELRPLSERGRDEARSLARRLAAHSTPPALVLTSPLLRARQTAEAITDATGSGFQVDDRLGPGATGESLRAAVEGVGAATVAVVGHQPDCSQIAVELTGADPGFPTGGVAEIALDT